MTMSLQNSSAYNRHRAILD